MRGSVEEVARVAAAEGIDADLARGGTIVLARSEPQLARAREEVAESDEFGLGISAARRGCGPSPARRAPGCSARPTPRTAPRCSRRSSSAGWPRSSSGAGRRLFEQTPALAVEPHAVRTAAGTVRAQHVVRATEGYTARLRGTRRRLAPVYSLIIATEPLPDATWDEIGLRERETFSDHRHLIIYGQRTADGRMVFGGRGAPVPLASRIDPSYDRVPGRVRRAAARRSSSCSRCCATPGSPTAGAARWGSRGTGTPRSGSTVRAGMAWAGGYVGDGVSTTNLAGRTLADLIIGDRETELTAAAVGRAPQPQLGARAAALDRRERRAAGDDLGRQRRAAPRPAVANGLGWSTP